MPYFIENKALSDRNGGGGGHLWTLTHVCPSQPCVVSQTSQLYLPQTCSFQSPVFLRCKIDEEVTHKAWLNRSNILFTGTDKWSLDPRVSLVNSNNSDFSIKIEQVMVADEGPYTCSFQARNQPRTAHVYLIVQGMPLQTN